MTERKPDRQWTFPANYPKVGGKTIAVCCPTAGDERDVLAAREFAMNAAMVATAGEASGGRSASPRADGVDARIDVAKRCMVQFDGLPLNDQTREQVWDDELDGWARADMLAWVDHCMTPTNPEGPHKPPFLA